MKFDKAHTTATFEKLEDEAFSKTDRESRVADFVARELEGMGYQVVRHEVWGSRFPQRAAPLLGWLGYGILTTALFAMILRMNWFAACFLLVLATRWALYALTNTTIRLGRRIPPLAAAPLLIAKSPTDSRPAIRVVFQAVLGGIRTDFFHSIRANRRKLFAIHSYFLVCLTLALVATLIKRPDRARMVVVITSLFLIAEWTIVSCVLFWEYRQLRLSRKIGDVDRWGLTALLELARGWPRNRSREIETVFVAAGGQRLDYAGSREVIRLLQFEWPTKPSLLVLLFAPAAGERLRPSEKPLRIDGLYPRELELAKQAAASLWIPVQRNDFSLLFMNWPSEKMNMIEAISLTGSDPRAHFDGSESPEALHRITQLATEIALRWSKQKTAQGDSSQASSTTSEVSTKKGDENP